MAAAAAAAPQKEEPLWTPGRALVLAGKGCRQCEGRGVVADRRHGRLRYSSPCVCVLRKVFRICLARFREIVLGLGGPSRVSYSAPAPGAVRRSMCWGRPHEEYAADFWLVARRHLDAQEWGIFRLHFLQGSEWRQCCERLKMERGQYFHAVYRIERRLGRVFAELAPYGLFPLDEYFGGRRKGALNGEKR